MIHGLSPCCASVILWHGSPVECRCSQCRQRIDPLDVVDPSPLLMRVICKVGSTIEE